MLTEKEKVLLEALQDEQKREEIISVLQSHQLLPELPAKPCGTP